MKLEDVTQGIELLGKRGSVRGFGERWNGVVIAALDSFGETQYSKEAPDDLKGEGHPFIFEDTGEFSFLPDGHDYPVFCWVGDNDFTLDEAE